jgi:PIN domain nuclease of toxin-antitoxin system
MSVVLDTSALLAVILGEPGSDMVLAEADGALVCAVNLFEILDVAARQGYDPVLVREQLDRMGLAFAHFDDAEAMIAPTLPRKIGKRGLSLADRCCLAFAVARGLPVLTGDRDWMKLDLPIEVRLIRD